MAFKQVHCCLCCCCCSSSGGGGLMLSIFVLLLKFIALGGCANGQFVKYIKFCSPRWHNLFFEFSLPTLVHLGATFCITLLIDTTTTK